MENEDIIEINSDSEDVKIVKFKQPNKSKINNFENKLTDLELDNELENLLKHVNEEIQIKDFEINKKCESDLENIKETLKKITDTEQLSKISNKKIITGLIITVIAYVIFNILVQYIFLNLDKLINMIQYYSLIAIVLYLYHVNIHPILDFLEIDEQEKFNLI